MSINKQELFATISGVIEGMDISQLRELAVGSYLDVRQSLQAQAA